MTKAADPPGNRPPPVSAGPRCRLFGGSCGTRLPVPSPRQSVHGFHHPAGPHRCMRLVMQWGRGLEDEHGGLGSSTTKPLWPPGVGDRSCSDGSCPVSSVRTGWCVQAVHGPPRRLERRRLTSLRGCARSHPGDRARRWTGRTTHLIPALPSPFRQQERNLRPAIQLPRWRATSACASRTAIPAQERCCGGGGVAGAGPWGRRGAFLAVGQGVPAGGSQVG